MRSRLVAAASVAVGALAACAPKPPEPLGPVTNAGASVTEPTYAVPVHETSAPRPDLDVAGIVPDFHELLRWPLTAMSHPVLEPHFNVAAVFADPGVTWIDLCERGAQNRSLGGRYSDEMQYLRGWCHVLQHDVDTALGELTPLLHSGVRDMPAAVRIDIANVIVDSGDAEKAEHWLSRHGIDDLETLDTLGASYVEVGKESDALQINTRLLGMSRSEPDDIKCRRFAKQLALSPPGERPDAFAVLESAATKPKVPDPVCVELYHEAQCWNDPANSCGSYLADQKLEYRYARILWLWYRWPQHEATYQTWLAVANQAWAAIAIAGAEKALLVALDAAERTQVTCPKEMKSIIEGAMKHPQIGTETRQALAAFQDRCEKSQHAVAVRAASNVRAGAATATICGKAKLCAMDAPSPPPTTR